MYRFNLKKDDEDFFTCFPPRTIRELDMFEAQEEVLHVTPDGRLKTIRSPIMIYRKEVDFTSFEYVELKNIR